jgi:hypothetical protein
MKKIKFASTTMMILVLFFVIYNTVFGWNKLPINEAEKTCDYIFKIGMYFAWAIYFLPLLDVYQNFIKKHEVSKKD